MTPGGRQWRTGAQRARLDLSDPPAPAAAEADPPRGLGISACEAEVLRLLALRRTNRQIANELYISEETASVHVSHLLRKLGVANRIEASAIAQRLGPPSTHGHSVVDDDDAFDADKLRQAVRICSVTAVATVRP